MAALGASNEEMCSLQPRMRQDKISGGVGTLEEVIGFRTLVHSAPLSDVNRKQVESQRLQGLTRKK